MPPREALAALVAVICACGDDGKTDPPLFPADYAASYQEVRNCRFSIDHDLLYIRVLASPEALTPYMTRAAPFPVGAILLKEQYGQDDTTCSGPLDSFTVMEKLDDGTTSAADWTWQKVGADRRQITVDLKTCTSCHSDCGYPPNGVGYDGTCTVP